MSATQREGRGRTHELVLRRLVLHDERLLEGMLASRAGNLATSQLDLRAHALVRLGAILALSNDPASLHASVDEALDAGVTEAEIVGALIAVAPVIGSARAVAWAPTVSLAIDYDVEAALEAFDEEEGRAWAIPAPDDVRREGV